MLKSLGGTKNNTLTIKTMKLEYKQNIDLSNINDSMELESGQVIATLEMGEQLVSLEVHGDVRVIYKDEVYKTQSQFPEELMQMFHDCSAFESPLVEIQDNNWFEMFLYEKKHTTWKWTGEADVVDVEGCKPHELLSQMIDYLNC